MKKILLILIVVFTGINLFGQTGIGWTQMRAKYNFKDSLNIANGWRIGAVTITPTGAQFNYLSIATGTTGTGSLVFSNSPTLVTPALGTPSAIVLTNATGTAASLTAGAVTGYTPASGSLTLSGADAITFTTSNVTSLTLPTSGTLATVMGTASVIADSIQRNAIFNHDYYIYKSGANVYAIPHPKTDYVAYTGTILSAVLQKAIDASDGGKYAKRIYIAEGLYTDCDSVRVTRDTITIEGAGMFKTIFKVKDNWDAAKSTGTYGVFQVIGKHYFTMRNIQFDGNGATMTYIDDNSSPGVGREHGIGITTVGTLPIKPLIENCYIHDFAGSAGIWMNATDPIVRNNLLIDNYSNQLTLNQYTTDAVVYGNYCKGGGDVGISLYCNYARVYDNVVEDINGTQGTEGSLWGISIEGNDLHYGDYNTISNNLIKGDMIAGISMSNDTSAISHIGNVFENNQIILNKTANLGIIAVEDSLSVYKGNFIKLSGSGNDCYGIKTYGTERSIFDDNTIVQAAGTAALKLSYDGAVYSLNNTFKNNHFYNASYYAIQIDANCDYNRFINNTLSGASADINQSSTATSNTMWYSNYGNYTGSWLQETGAKNLPYTATVGGAALKAGSQNVTITSPTSADHIIFLPTAGATTIGTKITGMVGATGFELRVADAQSGSVYLNGVNTASVEAAISANTSFEAIQVDATHWILKAWSLDGSIIAGIIPDAI